MIELRQLYYKLIALEWRRRRRRARRRRREDRIAQALVERYGLRVLEGPFAGMVYPAVAAMGSSLVPKLVGSYEREVHPFLQDAVRRQPGCIINIGCGEGYYAVGLALLLPTARIYAFDSDEAARNQSREMARLNGVGERVFIEGECTPERLRELTATPALVVCDCEGCELDLLRPDAVPGLANCDLIVELHTIGSREGTRPEILSRFASSHAYELTRYRRRDPSGYPALAMLARSDRTFALDEYRTRALEWVYLTSRAVRGQA